MSRATITVLGLAVYARHGVNPEEQRLGQRFIIDVTVDAEVTSAVAADDYEHALCYGTLGSFLIEYATSQTFRLIETLADRLARAVLERFPQAERAQVRVHKPGAPTGLPSGDVAVQVEHLRERCVGFSLGSNEGQSAALLALAINRLATAERLRIEAVSSTYRTAPWGVADQAPFLNLCAVGYTSLTPMQVLRLCKDIELELGRVPGLRWGPRAVDIDLLYLGSLTLRDHVLTLPHPRMTERAFVLQPLAEIAPQQTIAGRTVAELLNDVPRAVGDVEVLRGPEEMT